MDPGVTWERIQTILCDLRTLQVNLYHLGPVHEQFYTLRQVAELEDSVPLEHRR